MTRLPAFATVLLVALTAIAAAPSGALEPFQPDDVFELEWAADPRISPDGGKIVYVRRGMDRHTDRPTGSLWTIGVDGSGHRPLGTGGTEPSSPRWSPDGSRLAYVAGDEHGRRQIWVRWMESGESTPLTRLEEGPGDVAWSPDGSMLAFTAFVPADPEPFATTLAPPEGADWAPKAKVIDRLIYRRDGGGYTEAGNTQLFAVPAEGGTPRRLTDGPYDHGDPAWTPDGRHLLVVSNRRDDWEYDPQNTEIYEIALADGSIRALTDRHGPDEQPAVSPDGTKIAYRGFDDRYQGFQVRHLYVMDRDGSNPRRLTESLDRGVSNPTWSADERSILVSYSSEGNGRIAAVGLDGTIREIARDFGGLSLGRPYSGGAFSAAAGAVVFTHTRPDHPADLAVAAGGKTRRLTRLNDDLFGQRELAEVEEIWTESSHDGRRVQGWIAKPPGFDPAKAYPLILEIHGGPFANYGDRFAAEVQLYAAAGYLVLYTNPRGSTSYGEEFGNLIHHAYPGNDFHDLMSSVDAVIERGWVDPERLYVTGGSGGGVLTAWIVGHTDRFAAAASQKPVINWASWALTADIPIVARYWFPVPPWEDPDGYWQRSPLAFVGNVTTPTMVLTGEVDYRTPISESEQFYQALMMRRIDTVLVRIPEASHGIAARPSHLLAKVAHVLEWFRRHGGEDGGE